uniref:Nuclear receptor domain-containing protein n=1 Tax=Ascaris lumbricoides TaxID=6252 RepID=A0A0M3IEM0_ASCLU
MEIFASTLYIIRTIPFTLQCKLFSVMSEASCSGFEPQAYLRDRCKKCFRLKSKHDELECKATAAPASPTSSVSTNCKVSST